MIGCSSAMTSRLSLAAMTVDRACAVLFPLKARTLCTASRAKKVIVIVTIIEFGLDVNIFFTFKMALIGTDFATFVLDFKDYPWLEPLVAVSHLAIGRSTKLVSVI
jgi:hypothetical protein